ncbi:transcriptional regulator [Serratia marcescens]|nr:transcriptional regulator [Serratia marcescens]
MLSQMNLRFPKSLIAALKNRAAAEAVPVNTLGQLYRKIVRAETVDGQAQSRAELRWLFAQAQIAYRDGRGPVNRAPLSSLLLITDALLETAVGGGLDVDPHYYRSTFGLRGEDWLQALRDRFTATHTPPAGSAEFFARPLARACTPVRLRALFPLAVAAQRADDPALTTPFVERQQLIAAAGELRATVEIVTGQGAYPGADDGLPPFLSLLISGAVFQSTFSWPVFAELRRLLRARQDGARTRSYQERHVSLHVPENGDIGLVLPNLRLAQDTFTALEAELLAQLEHPAAAAALAELAALYGDL